MDKALHGTALIAAVAVSSALSGCGGDPPPPDGTYRAIQPTLESKCAPCHTTDGSGGVSFARRYEDTQGASALCPGQTVAECMLVLVQMGTMPLGRGCSGDPEADADNSACLTAEEQASLESWVAAGAPE